MNRITKAWKALRGTLEPEVREVEKEVEVAKTVERTILGSPVPVTVYLVDVPTGGLRTFKNYDGETIVIGQETKPHYYTTCEQAHAEHPGRKVVAMEMWRIGNEYLSSLEVCKITLQPKPKRPKGARG